MTIWFTSDEHLDDASIIPICNRPWGQAEEMSLAIINNVNEMVREGDTLYHIGDWCRHGIMHTLRAQQLMSMYKKGITHVLILGNHDRLPPFDYIEMGFMSVHTSLIIYQPFYAGQEIALVHDPCVFDIVKDKYILACGHGHGLFKNMPGVVNVGVDLHDYKPITLERVIKLSREKGEE